MTDRERINTIYNEVSARNVPGDPHLSILFRISDLVDAICDARRDLGGEVDLRLRAEIHVSVMNSIMDWEEEICPGDPTISHHLAAEEHRPLGWKLTRWGKDADKPNSAARSKPIDNRLKAERMLVGNPYRCRCCGVEFTSAEEISAHWRAAN